MQPERKMDLSKTRESHLSELGTFRQVAIIIFLLSIYPLFSMFWYHSYPVFSVEVLILIVAAAGIALGISWLLQRVSVLITNLTIVVFITLVFLVQFNLLFVGMIAVFVVGLTLALVFGQKFQVWLPFVLCALIVGAGLDQVFYSPARSHELVPNQKMPARGPIIHLLMDGFIGPAGLPQDPDSQLLRSEIIEFFRDYDFNIYTKAYSHYGSTVDSMTRLLNFRNDDENIFQRLRLLKEPLRIDESKWFNALDRSGRKLVVYQTESVDFCSPALSQPIICNVFPMPNLYSLHRDLHNPFKKATMLIYGAVSQSTILRKAASDAEITALDSWGISVFDERIIDQLSRNIQKQPDNAYFAHILVPHPPFIFSNDCSINYQSEPWTRWPNSRGKVSNSVESLRIRRQNIKPQIQCALNLLTELFNKLKADGLFENSTIIVHGDHGTSAYMNLPEAQNMNNLTYRDLQEAYSALFAIKYPNGQFKLNEEVKSLNVLMAEAALSILGTNMDRSEIEVLEEPEPFIYLSGASLMTKAYIDIFNDPKNKELPDEGESETVK